VKDLDSIKTLTLTLTALLVATVVLVACVPAAVVEAPTTTEAAPTASATTSLPPNTTTTGVAATTSQPPAATTVAPTTTTEAPLGEVTVDDLVGAWGTSKGNFIQFNEDGTYSVAFLAEWLDNDDKKIGEGEFTLEGNLLTDIPTTAGGNCAAGDRITYEIGMLEDGRVRYRLVDTPCEYAAGFPEITLARIEP